MQEYCSFCWESAIDHIKKSITVGAIEHDKKFVEYCDKQEWVSHKFCVTSPEDFDYLDLDIETSDFSKPEKFDPDTEYLWVVESGGIDYLIRAKTEEEAGRDCIGALGSCERVRLFSEVYSLDIEKELR